MNQLTELQRHPHGRVDVEGSFQWLSDAHEAIRKYKLQFHPYGYGTQLHVRMLNGGYLVTGHRSDNCD